MGCIGSKPNSKSLKILNEQLSQKQQKIVSLKYKIFVLQKQYLLNQTTQKKIK